MRLKEDMGLAYEKNEIIVSTGAKSSLYHLIQALINEDDEVIIPAPYWVTYPHPVSLANGKAVLVPTTEEDGFLLTPEQLKAVITPATKALDPQQSLQPDRCSLPKTSTRSTGGCHSGRGYLCDRGRDLRQTRLRRF